MKFIGIGTCIAHIRGCPVRWGSVGAASILVAAGGGGASALYKFQIRVRIGRDRSQFRILGGRDL